MMFRKVPRENKLSRVNPVNKQNRHKMVLNVAAIDRGKYSRSEWSPLEIYVLSLWVIDIVSGELTVKFDLLCFLKAVES